MEVELIEKYTTWIETDHSKSPSDTEYKSASPIGTFIPQFVFKLPAKFQQERWKSSWKSSNSFKSNQISVELEIVNLLKTMFWSVVIKLLTSRITARTSHLSDCPLYSSLSSDLCKTFWTRVATTELRDIGLSSLSPHHSFDRGVLFPPLPWYVAHFYYSIPSLSLWLMGKSFGELEINKYSWAAALFYSTTKNLATSQDPLEIS